MIKNFMTKKLITVKPENSLVDAVALMAENRLSGLPVVDDDNVLLGFVPSLEIFRSMLPDIPAYFNSLYGTEDIPAMAGVSVFHEYLTEKEADLRSLKVKDIMVDPAYVLKEDASFLEAINAYIEYGINRIAVVDEENHLKGILCRNNLMQELHTFLNKK